MNQTSPTKHAELSPSSASRWMACPGSVALSRGIPRRSSKYADEGTQAHDIAAKALLAGGLMPICPDREMGKHIKTYVDNVRAAAKGHTLLVEQALSLTPITGEFEAFGTADAVIIHADGATLEVHDLKYGMGVEVSSEENPQLMIYALAALRQYAMMGDFTKVVMGIHQVRLNDVPEVWEASVKDLMVFSEVAKNAADKVRSIARIFDASGQFGEDEMGPDLNPGEKQCRFCPAKATCPALTATAIETMGDQSGVDFDSFVDEPQALVTHTRMVSVADTDKIFRLLPLVPLIRDWCKGVEERATAIAMAGEPPPDWKLVEGKRGNRSWRDENEVEVILQGMRLSFDEIHSYKLVSVAEAEKRMKDKYPRRWQRLLGFVERADGKPVLVPATDKRPALVVDNTNLFLGMADED